MTSTSLARKHDQFSVDDFDESSNGEDDRRELSRRIVGGGLVIRNKKGSSVGSVGGNSNVGRDDSNSTNNDLLGNNSSRSTGSRSRRATSTSNDASTSLSSASYKKAGLGSSLLSSAKRLITPGGNLNANGTPPLPSSNKQRNNTIPSMNHGGSVNANLSPKGGRKPQFKPPPDFAGDNSGQVPSTSTMSSSSSSGAAGSAIATATTTKVKPQQQESAPPLTQHQPKLQPTVPKRDGEEPVADDTTATTTVHAPQVPAIKRTVVLGQSVKPPTGHTVRPRATRRKIGDSKPIDFDQQLEMYQDETERQKKVVRKRVVVRKSASSMVGGGQLQQYPFDHEIHQQNSLQTRPSSQRSKLKVYDPSQTNSEGLVVDEMISSPRSKNVLQHESSVHASLNPNRAGKVGRHNIANASSNDIAESSMAAAAGPLHQRTSSDMDMLSIKHAEEMYWMKLELETVRKSKEAVEDRIAALYRDVQDFIQQGSPKEGGKRREKRGDDDDDNHYSSDESGFVNFIGKSSLHSHKSTSSGDSIDSKGIGAATKKVKKKGAANESKASMQLQIEKYERMLRIMKNQTEIIKKSSSEASATLKSEISKIIAENNKNEMSLMNKLAVAYRDKNDVAEKLKVANQKIKEISQSKKEESNQLKSTVKVIRAENEKLRQQLVNEQAKTMDRFLNSTPSMSKDAGGRRQKLRPEDLLNDDSLNNSHSQTSTGNRDDDFMMHSKRELRDQQREQIDLLQTTNQQLTESLKQARKISQANFSKWTNERASLQDTIMTLQEENKQFRRNNIEAIQQERDVTLQALATVSELMNQTHESVKEVETVIAIVANRKNGFIENQDDDQTYVTQFTTDYDRVLTFLESGLLVHNEVKMSLTQIELKLRTNLDALPDVSTPSALVGGVATISANERLQRQRIIQDITESMRRVEERITTELRTLQEQSQLETDHVKSIMSEKVAHLKAMMSKQAKLEEEINQIQQQKLSTDENSTNTTSEAPQPVEDGTVSNEASSIGYGNAEGSVDDSALSFKDNKSQLELFVSQRALETLQTEVLVVVQRVKEQNETIARLRSEIEELHIRERTLMSELKRNLNNQLSRQMHTSNHNDMIDDFDNTTLDTNIIATNIYSDDPPGVHGSFDENIDDGYDDNYNTTPDVPIYFTSGEAQYPESDNEFSEDDNDDVSYEEVEYEDDEDGDISDGSYEECTVYEEQTVYGDQTIPTVMRELSFDEEQTVYDEQSVYDDQTIYEEVSVYDEQTVYDDDDNVSTVNKEQQNKSRPETTNNRNVIYEAPESDGEDESLNSN
jgi:hypothetical protein